MLNDIIRENIPAKCFELWCCIWDQINDLLLLLLFIIIIIITNTKSSKSLSYQLDWVNPDISTYDPELKPDFQVLHSRVGSWINPKH